MFHQTSEHETEAENNEDICCLCLETNENSSLYKTLCCGNFMHFSCIFEAQNVFKSCFQCPFCRRKGIDNMKVDSLTNHEKSLKEKLNELHSIKSITKNVIDLDRKNEWKLHRYHERINETKRKLRVQRVQHEKECISIQGQIDELETANEQLMNENNTLKNKCSYLAQKKRLNSKKN